MTPARLQCRRQGEGSATQPFCALPRISNPPFSSRKKKKSSKSKDKSGRALQHREGGKEGAAHGAARRNSSTRRKLRGCQVWKHSTAKAISVWHLVPCGENRLVQGFFFCKFYSPWRTEGSSLCAQSSTRASVAVSTRSLPSRLDFAPLLSSGKKNAELSLKTAAAQPHFGAMQAPEWKRTPSETLFPTLGHTAPQHISLKRHLHQDKGALCTADLSACFHTERNHAGLIRAGL